MQRTYLSRGLKHKCIPEPSGTNGKNKECDTPVTDLLSSKKENLLHRTNKNIPVSSFWPVTC